MMVLVTKLTPTAAMGLRMGAMTMMVLVMTMMVRAPLARSLVTAMATTTMTTLGLQDRAVRSLAKAARKIAKPRRSRFAENVRQQATRMGSLLSSL